MNPSRPRHPRVDRRWWLKAAVIAGLTALAYLPACHGSFIWDDELWIGWARAPGALHRFWFTAELPDYWPLSSTLWWTLWRIWGEDPLPYHVINVALHAANALLAWRALERLNIQGAWLAALLFALHPVNVATVAWVTEIKTTLSFCLALLALLAYFRFEDSGRPGWYATALLTFGLALLAKTSVVMLPVILLGCAWWRKQRLGLGDLARSVPFFALAAAMAAVTLWINWHPTAGITARPEGFLSRLAAAGWSVCFYLWKAVAPVQLSAIYPRWDVDGGSLVSYAPDLAVAGVFAGAWWQRRSWGRPVLFALGYFVVTLFPILGFFSSPFMLYSLVADYWQYVSIIGVIALAVAAGHRACTDRPASLRRLAAAGAAALVLLFGILSYGRAGIYENAETFWDDTLASNPAAWVAHLNVGNILQGRGRSYAAIAHYEAASRLNPRYAMAHSNLGIALARERRIEEAVGHLRQALQINPDFAEAHNNLATVLLGEGKIDEAIEHYETAVQISPGYATAHYNLGTALMRRGSVEEAVGHWRQALQINPDLAEAHEQLANALAREGRTHEAIEHYERALLLRPGLTGARSALARLRAKPD